MAGRTSAWASRRRGCATARRSGRTSRATWWCAGRRGVRASCAGDEPRDLPLAEVVRRHRGKQGHENVKGPLVDKHHPPCRGQRANRFHAAGHMLLRAVQYRLLPKARRHGIRPGAIWCTVARLVTSGGRSLLFASHAPGLAVPQPAARRLDPATPPDRSFRRPFDAACPAAADALGLYVPVPDSRCHLAAPMHDRPPLWAHVHGTPARALTGDQGELRSAVFQYNPLNYSSLAMTRPTARRRHAAMGQGQRNRGSTTFARAPSTMACGVGPRRQDQFVPNRAHNLWRTEKRLQAGGSAAWVRSSASGRRARLRQRKVLHTWQGPGGCLLYTPGARDAGVDSEAGPSAAHHSAEHTSDPHRKAGVPRTPISLASCLHQTTSAPRKATQRTCVPGPARMWCWSLGWC